MEDTYETSFGLILHAGNSKSKSLMAIEAARENEFKQAKDFIKEAEDDLRQAHQRQTNMIQAQARGDKVEVDIILVHAQDHLTMAMIMLNQAKEFIHLYEMLNILMKKEES